MRCFAAMRLRDWFDIVRPAPSRLKDKSADFTARDLQNLGAAMRKLACLVQLRGAKCRALVAIWFTLLARPLLGQFVDRFGFRRVMLPAFVMFSIAMASLSLIGAQIWIFVVIYGSANFFASSGPVAYSKCVALWFDADRFALRIATAGAKRRATRALFAAPLGPCEFAAGGQREIASRDPTSGANPSIPKRSATDRDLVAAGRIGRLTHWRFSADSGRKVNIA